MKLDELENCGEHKYDAVPTRIRVCSEMATQ